MRKEPRFSLLLSAFFSASAADRAWFIDDKRQVTTHVIVFEEAKHFQLPEDSFAAHETLKDIRQFF